MPFTIATPDHNIIHYYYYSHLECMLTSSSKRVRQRGCNAQGEDQEAERSQRRMVIKRSRHVCHRQGILSFSLTLIHTSNSE